MPLEIITLLLDSTKQKQTSSFLSTSAITISKKTLDAPVRAKATGLSSGSQNKVSITQRHKTLVEPYSPAGCKSCECGLPASFNLTLGQECNVTSYNCQYAKSGSVHGAKIYADVFNLVIKFYLNLNIFIYVENL